MGVNASFPFFISVTHKSKPPIPFKPFEAKNNCPSGLNHGNNSCPVVFNLGPKLSASPIDPSALMLAIYKSVPPRPSSISDTKTIYFPSGEIAGCPVEYPRPLILLGLILLHFPLAFTSAVYSLISFLLVDLLVFLSLRVK